MKLLNFDGTIVTSLHYLLRNDESRATKERVNSHTVANDEEVANRLLSVTTNP